jgi:5-methylcytosine-specific restriction protein A
MKRKLSEPIQIQTKDGRVIAEYLPDGKVKVIKGSYFRDVEVNSLRQNAKNERLYLINNGYIKNHQLTNDYIFDNPTIAISTLLGRLEKGNLAFVTKDNIGLDSYLETNSKTSNKKNNRLNELFLKVKKNNGINLQRKTLADEDDEEGYIATIDIDESLHISVEYKPEAKSDRYLANKKSYKRSIDKARKSIVLADYKCELDNTHKTFITKSGKSYMEAHHLIPLSVQEYFEYSLDVEANIVSLCPNCHRELHYGKKIDDKLLELYNKRIGYMNESGLTISYEDLVKLYTL